MRTGAGRREEAGTPLPSFPNQSPLGNTHSRHRAGKGRSGKASEGLREPAQHRLKLLPAPSLPVASPPWLPKRGQRLTPRVAGSFPKLAPPCSPGGLGRAERTVGARVGAHSLSLRYRGASAPVWEDATGLGAGVSPSLRASRSLSLPLDLSHCLYRGPGLSCFSPAPPPS